MGDVEVLSRIQFAMTIMFHYIFPPFSIGIGTLMVLMEGTYLYTGDKRYHTMTRFWTGIFAVCFAMGVGTGLVMEFQFGTNWAGYSRYVGDIFGSALAAEGIFAFFLESGFLAVLVFGWDKVSKRMHFFATLMVALGSMFSAVWIVIANSFMHTPAGYQIDPSGANRLVISHFWEMVFNPSSMQRLTHVVLGAYLQGSFFVVSVSAYYCLQKKHEEIARRSLRIALYFAACSGLAILISGHFQGKAVAHNQPAKLAAFEGHFKTGPARMYFFGWPNVEEQRVSYGPWIPGGLSFLVKEDFSASLPGLDAFPPEKRPPVFVPFMTYHLMIGVGMGLLGLLAVSVWFLWRGTLFEQKWLLRVLVVAVLGPVMANQAGWVAAETGRQPYAVYPTVGWSSAGVPTMGDNGFRTSQGLSSRRVVGPSQVLASIAMFSFVYLMLFAVWVYVLHSKIQHGPEVMDTLVPDATSPEGLIAAAAGLAPGGYSMTVDSTRADGETEGRP